MATVQELAFAIDRMERLRSTMRHHQTRLDRDRDNEAAKGSYHEAAGFNFMGTGVIMAIAQIDDEIKHLHSSRAALLKEPT